MAALSEEEENYVRMSLLLTGVSPRAVRCKFDREFSPAVLQATIKKEFKKLDELKIKRIINQAQWNILHPRNGTTPDSGNFDITLMICLLRNIATMTPPSYGFDCLPHPADISDGADLARIKHYRNYLAHLDDTKIDNSYFSAVWTDVVNAISRLGGQVMEQECQDLKIKVLDQSNKEIMLEIKQSCDKIEDLQKDVMELKSSNVGLKSVNEEKAKIIGNLTRGWASLKTEHGEKIEKLEDAKNDPIPWNIRTQITEKLSSWKQDENDFVATRAAKRVLECLTTNRCVTVTGSPGMGKTATVRHVALQMQAEGYNIIPLMDPSDIITFYNPNKKTLYVVDDLCGTYNLNVNDLHRWKNIINDLTTQCEKKLSKIIVTCRLQVYQDEKFDTLSLFKSCECNLLSDDLVLLQAEKQSIAELYLETESAKIVDYYDLYDCFPLLCKLYKANNNELNIDEFFQNPFSIYEAELEKLRTEGKGYKLCALALCVMFNNCLNEELLTEEIDENVRKIIETTCEGCKLNRGISRLRLRDELDALVDTFVKKKDGFYQAIHDRLFDFLAFYFGKVMIKLLIKNSKSDFIRVRFLFDRQDDSDQFNIIVPIEYQDMYIQRMFDDWSKGQVADTFFNKNMENSTFSKKFKNHFDNLQKQYQKQLVQQHDVRRRDSVMMLCSCRGNTDMVHWCINHGVDVNYCGRNGGSSLFVACQYGHVQVVKMLLVNQANINMCTDDGISPLFIACVEGHVDVVKLLLNKKADINLRVSVQMACHDGHLEVHVGNEIIYSKARFQSGIYFGASPVDITWLERSFKRNECFLKDNTKIQSLVSSLSPMCIACHAGHLEIVRMLLNSKADINKCVKDGTSPLSIACREGHMNVVKLLLNKMADIDECGPHVESPLFIACQEGHVEIVKLLLNNKADINKCMASGDSPLFIACQEGHTEIVKLLLKSEADVNKCLDNGASPLFIACHQGQIEIVKILLQTAAGINKGMDDGASPLYTACHHGHVEVVKILLNNEADFDKCMTSGESPLLIACQEGHVEVVKLLLNSKADINKCGTEGESPLFMACQEGHVEIVKLILKSEANVNKCMDNGASPLFIACQQGDIEIVKILLNSKADIDKCYINGQSPLYIACQKGYKEVVKLLLKNKANINKCRTSGESPLFMACQEGHTEVVKVLLESATDVNTCVDRGESPFYIACQEGHVEIVKLLLKSEADVNKCMDNVVSPLFIACYQGNVDVVKILLSCNSDININPIDVALFQGNLEYFTKIYGVEVVEILLNNDAANGIEKGEVWVPINRFNPTTDNC